MSSDGAPRKIGTLLAGEFVAVYMIYKKGVPAARAGKIAVADYGDVYDLENAVVATVKESERFPEIKPGQLLSGDFFVLKQPTVGRPSHPGKDGLSVGEVKVKAGDCILLDITASEFLCTFFLLAIGSATRFAISPTPPSACLRTPHRAHALCLQARLLLAELMLAAAELLSLHKLLQGLLVSYAKLSCIPFFDGRTFFLQFFCNPPPQLQRLSSAK